MIRVNDVVKINDEHSVYNSMSNLFESSFGKDTFQLVYPSYVAQYRAYNKSVNDEVHDYCANDAFGVHSITKVIFNNPATIVFWGDGTKTIVKAEGEAFDPEKGLAMAICKKALGNKGNYYNTFRKWLPKKNVDGVNVAVEFDSKTWSSDLSYLKDIFKDFD